MILITGGSRSGKSSYAQRLAESVPGRRAFVATCPVIDAEMEERIRKHQEARGRSSWDTIEETTNLAQVLRNARDHHVILIDCLTLWVNNLMYEAERNGTRISEQDIAGRCAELLDACAELPGTVVFVTNEVGMGIVPDNAVSRCYRDLVGRCNQTMASAADVVTLVVCGVPLTIKEGNPE